MVSLVEIERPFTLPAGGKIARAVRLSVESSGMIARVAVVQHKQAAFEVKLGSYGAASR